MTQLNKDYQDGRWAEVEPEERFSADLQCCYAFTPYRDYLHRIFEMLNKGFMRKLTGEDAWTTEY